MKYFSALILAFFAVACAPETAETTANTNSDHPMVTDLKNKVMGLDEGTVYIAFSYRCIHCFNLHSEMKSNPLPADVTVEYIPVAWNAGMREDMKYFYASQYLNVEAKMTDMLFQIIHDQRVNISGERQFEQIFGLAGVSAEELKGALNSNYVAENVKIANALSKIPELKGTPSIFRGGDKIIDTELAKGNYNAILEAAKL